MPASPRPLFGLGVSATMSRGGPYDPARAHGARYANGAAGLYSDDEKTNIFGAEATYYAAGATRTRANSTLFVRNLPSASRAVTAEELFGGMPGYCGVRCVRSITFVDFDSIKAATNAMIRFQGHRVDPEQLTPGLVIDYDKDTGKADAKGGEQKRSLAKMQSANRSAAYFCCACGTLAFRTKDALLSELPARGTDGAAVVDEATQLSELLLLPPPTGAPPVSVRRAKGVEKQLRLTCRSCDAQPAYRSARTSVGTPNYLYVHPERVSLSSDGPSDAAKRARAASEAARDDGVQDIIRIELAQDRAPRSEQVASCESNSK